MKLQTSSVMLNEIDIRKPDDIPEDPEIFVDRLFKEGCLNEAMNVLNVRFWYIFSKEDVEDIVAVAVDKAFKNRDKFNPEIAQLSTWFCSIAKNTARDANRKKKKTIPVTSIDNIKLDNVNDYDDAEIEESELDENTFCDPILEFNFDDFEQQTSHSLPDTIKRAYDVFREMLPPTQKSLLLYLLDNGDDISNGEIAEYFKISIGTARKRRHDLKKSMAQILSELGSVRFVEKEN